MEDVLSIIESMGLQMVNSNSFVNVHTGEIISVDKVKESLTSLQQSLSANSHYTDQQNTTPLYKTHCLGWKKSNSFSKLFHVQAKEMTIGVDMDINEHGMLSLLSKNIEWETNRVVVNGRNITNKFIKDELKIGDAILTRTLNSLEERRLIRRVGSKRNREIYVNPEYIILGKNVLKSTVDLFKI